MIKLSKNDFQKMVEYAKSQLPNEACGLIAGIITDKGKEVKKVYYLTNTESSNKHFSLDIREQIGAIKDMRGKGYQLLGNWHSHPVSSSEPSVEDKRLAYDNSASYLILSLMEMDNPVLHSFHIEGNLAEKEELVIQ